MLEIKEIKKRKVSLPASTLAKQNQYLSLECRKESKKALGTLNAYPATQGRDSQTHGLWLPAMLGYCTRIGSSGS